LKVSLEEWRVPGKTPVNHLSNWRASVAAPITHSSIRPCGCGNLTDEVKMPPTANASEQRLALGSPRFPFAGKLRRSRWGHSMDKTGLVKEKIMDLHKFP
jgi:hypothetical protein